MKTLAALLVLFLWSGPVFAQDLSLPAHGNWCGIGHTGGGFASPPTDLLDATCMRHDICTQQQGRFNCGCDIGFMLELRGQIWPNPGLQAKARAIYDTIAVLPCTNANGMALKTEMVMSDWVKGVTSGREAPWDILRRMGLLGQGSLQNGGVRR